MNGKMQKINFTEKLNKFNELWTPKVIAELNNYQFKLAKIHGEFVWHSHDDTDEAFIVIRGKMAIEFRDRTVNLEEGEMFIVPKDVEHRPYAEEECHIMLIEPQGVVNTGESAGELTAPNDNWV
ncbi:cupin domain-containing protein [Candidatus Uabimicrobium sp. HlEnr_7]|uniref:cupin domain-containing protein n=1 Tax=Candidatus Uabimicrobium helgolandensis TaxID=3095367 RepID=UPI0035592060